MKKDSRQHALSLIKQIETERQFSHVTIQRFLVKNSVSDMDRRFITHLVNGVLENKMLIDYWIRKMSSVRFGKLHPDLINVLRLGLFQLAFMDKVPESAAVNESVKMAKDIRKDFGNYANGILRSFVRMGKWIEPPDRKVHPVTHLSILYSHPEWMVQKWVDLYGMHFTEALLKANNQVPPLSLRINRLKTTREAWLALLLESGTSGVASDIAEDGVVIDKMSHQGLEMLPGYEEGHFQVQDISSMCVAQVVNIEEGQLVIDVCAAPGGKATHIAERLNNTGKVIARDLQFNKLDVIKENVNRLGLSNVVVEQFDALELDPQLIGKADVVLVDAPCSGLGIIRRKPDIKYNKSIEDLADLVSLQSKILDISSAYVKVGGQLIYSTCTLNPDENDGVVNAFLTANKNFKREVISNVKGVQSNGAVTLYPNIDETDGFYISKLMRTE